MPTYDYLCTKCGHQFEEIQKMSDPVLKSCPECRGKLKRLIGAGVGVIFKGSGFYATDSRGKNEPKAGSESSTSKSEPAAKTESTSASKTDSKTESKSADKSAAAASGSKS